MCCSNLIYYCDEIIYNLIRTSYYKNKRTSASEKYFRIDNYELPKVSVEFCILINLGKT